MTVPRSGKAASAHIRQIGPERYHGLRIKVNRRGGLAHH